MSGKLCFLVCHNFLHEINAAISAEGWPDVVAADFPARCGRPPVSWNELRTVLPEGCVQVVILGHACLGGLCEAPADFPAVRMMPQEQCFNMVAASTLVTEAIGNGGYLITPSWLSNWRERISEMGFTPEHSGEFFKDFARELVLFDTGIDTEAKAHLAEMSDALGLPGKRISVGLDHARLMLARAVLEWRLNDECRSRQELNRHFKQELADQVLALDMLGRLVDTEQESDAISAIEELFRMLFSPTTFHYLHVVNGQPVFDLDITADLQEALLRLESGYAWTPSGQGFLLQIAHGDQLLGLIVIDRLSFPDHRQRYLNLALAMTGILALAIEDARVKGELKQYQSNLEILVEERTASLHIAEENAEAANRARQQLAESQLKLQTIIEAEPECVKVLATDGTLLQMNRAGLNMIEADSEEQILGSTMAGIVTPPYRESFKALSKRVNEGGSGTLEFEITGLKGGHRWLETHAVPLRDRDNRITGLLGLTRDITESKQNQQRLDRLMTEQKAMLENELIGIVKVRQRTILWANPAFEKMLGYSPGELNGMPTRQNYPSEEAWLAFGAVAYPVLSAGKVFRSQVEHVRKDGGLIWVDIGGSLLDSAREESLWSFVDITELKHSEAEVRAREARLTSLIASMQDIVIVFDNNGRAVEYFHPPMAIRPSVKPSEQILGKTYNEVLPANVASQVSEAISGILKDGRPRTFEYRLTINGKDYLSQATMSPLLDEAKKPTGFLKVIRDITAERAAQHEIEHLARTNTLLLKSVGDGIYGVDMDGKTTFVNSKALDMLGFTEAELLGCEQHQLIHHHHMDGAPYPGEECPVRLTRVDGQIRHAENEWFWRKDGSGFPVALTVTPLVESGNRMGAVVIFQDISERKANEAKIHDLAFYDPLTNLPNRRLLLDRLGLALPASARRNTYGAVLFLDLDNFKILNDSKGHESGDLLLIEVARRLLDCVRVEDTVARLGGDEFVVMLEDLSPEFKQAMVQAAAIGEKIRLKLNEEYSLTDYRHHCSSSIGIRLFKDPDVEVGELLKQADTAMYQAKSAGRNAVRFFQPDA